MNTIYIENHVLNIFRNNTKKALKVYDFNHDGVIEKNELIKLLQQAGYQWSSASQMATSIFNQLDADQNGYIDINDFQDQVNLQQPVEQSAQNNAFKQERPLSPIEEQILQIFRVNTQQALQAYNFNRDGVIEPNELIQIFQQAGYNLNSASQMAVNIFSQLDADQSGYISISDFRDNLSLHS